MTPLYTIAEIVAATGGEARSVTAGAINSISIDSREIEPGALFVAIRGENFDGHDFVARAIDAGAVAALVSKGHEDGLDGLPLVIVPDALEGLYGLARFSRVRSRAKIIGVTGSVGKTSVKEAIRAICSAHGRTHASIRSFNNHWGVPLMLARMPEDTEFGVFEIGMSHAGEITPLSRLVRPHVAVITTIAPAHLEFFDSEAAIADAKAEILAGLEPGGRVILGYDHAHIERLLAHAAAAEVDALTYGFDHRADISIEQYSAENDGGKAMLEGYQVDIEIGVATPGRHTLANGVAALLAAQECGVPLETALDVLARHGAPEGRGLAYRLGAEPKPLVLIDESYNANPASMRAALDVFAQASAPSGMRFLVLGDMRELGGAANLHHAELAPDVLAAAPDAVFLVGDHMEALANALPERLVAARVPAVAGITNDILGALAYGDLVMVKGSNGMRLGKLVEAIRARFGQ